MSVMQTDHSMSHRIGIVDDCYRCIDCEIGAWNAHKKPCPARAN